MKTIIKKYMKVLMVALMLLIPLGINNSVVYAEDSSVISDIELEIDYPTHGTLVEAEKYEDGKYKWDTQSVSPKVTIPEGETAYELDERDDGTKGAYWLDKNKEFFVGEFEAGKEYYARVWIRATDNNEFNSNKDEITVIVNGTKVTADDFYLTYESQNVYLCVTFKMECQPAVIDTIDLTITPPVPGTSTKLAIPNNSESQTNPPIVSIPNGVDYYLNTGEDNEYLYAYWVNELDVEIAFEGTFQVNNYYLANIYLKSNTGHVFSKDVTINITNGNLYDKVFMHTNRDYISILAYVKCVEQHKVTFDANGGTIDGASKKEIPVVDGKVFTWDELPEPTRAGKYMFYDWYTDKDCKNYFEYWKTPIEAPITLYAKWIECSVVDLGEGSIWGGQSILKMPLEKGHEEPIPLEEHLLGMDFKAPEGMRYVGVNIEGTQYKPGDVYKVTHNVMASAIYRPIGKDVLTFDLDGGKLGDQVGVAFLPYDNGQDIKLPAPTKDGATFDYWEGSKYYAGDPYTVNGDKVFKAVWKANPTPKPNYSIPKTGVE